MSKLKILGYGALAIVGVAVIVPKPPAPPPPTAQEQARAERDKRDLDRAMIGAAYVRDTMREPDSLRIESAVAMSSGAVCYEYAGRNGFGGYSREYAVLTPKGALSKKVWDRWCAGKTGNDQTAAVNANEAIWKLFATRR